MKNIPIVVGMNEVNISTLEQPVIGTDSLGPCVGVLLYDRKHKRAVVLHASTDWKELLVETLLVLADNKLISRDNFTKATKNLYLHEKYNLYDFDETTKRKLIRQHGLNITETKQPIEAIIVPGYYPDNYNVAQNIRKYLATLSPLITVKISTLPKNAIRTRMIEDLGSHEFYFDASTGKFVTNKTKKTLSATTYRL